jgi:hypothetical protein
MSMYISFVVVFVVVFVGFFYYFFFSPLLFLVLRLLSFREIGADSRQRNRT